MSDRKELAETLRKEGKSYREISKLTGIAQSTLSLWFRDQDWSKKVGDELRQRNIENGKLELFKHMRARSFALRFHYEAGKENARKEYAQLKKHPLFVAALSLYWGEGDRTSLYNCRLTNTDPRMIFIFQRFLREICQVKEEKIRYWLLLYPDLDEKACKEYWVRESKISPNSFTKSIVIRGKHKKNKVRFGVATIVCSSRYLKEKLIVWTQLLAEDLATSKVKLQKSTEK